MVDLPLAILESSDWIIIAVIVIVFASGKSVFTQQQFNLRRLERKLDAVIAHLGIEQTSGLSEEVRSLALTNKIAAIKLHREQTGVGLAEAKADIDDFLGHAS